MKQLTDQDAINEIAPLFCQHCKAIQKVNDTPVACLYNGLIEDRKHAFCAPCIDAVMSIRDKVNKLIK